MTGIIICAYESFFQNLSVEVSVSFIVPRHVKVVFPRFAAVSVVIPVLEVFFAFYSLFFGKVDITVRISFVVISVLAGFSGYLNVKHFIVPDVDFGIVRSIRGYNLIAFLIGLFSLAEIGFSLFEINGIIFYIQIALGILYAAAIPVLNSEVKKWTR